jgi:hypothetical protein
MFPSALLFLFVRHDQKRQPLAPFHGDASARAEGSVGPCLPFLSVDPDPTLVVARPEDLSSAAQEVLGAADDGVPARTQSGANGQEEECRRRHRQ